MKETFIKGGNRLIISGNIEDFKDSMAFARTKWQAISNGWTPLAEIVKRNAFDMKLSKITD